jgi:hypothetical protein
LHNKKKKKSRICKNKNTNKKRNQKGRKRRWKKRHLNTLIWRIKKRQNRRRNQRRRNPKKKKKKLKKMKLNMMKTKNALRLFGLNWGNRRIIMLLFPSMMKFCLCIYFVVMKSKKAACSPQKNAFTTSRSKEWIGKVKEATPISNGYDKTSSNYTHI